MKSFFSALRRYAATYTQAAVSPWYIEPLEVSDDWCGGWHIAPLEPPESQTYWMHDTEMIEKYNTKISAGGSMTIRLNVRDKALNRVNRSDVSSVKLNIFETMDASQTVDGYTNYTIPTTAILTAWSTDENGSKFNFEYNPYHDSKPMFPKRNTTYTIEVITFDLSNIPFARQMKIDAV